MATNLFHQLSITAASATLGLAVFNSLPATAAIVTYDFEFKYFAPYPEALLETPITGSFSYDESSFQARGFVGLDFVEGISGKPTIGSFSSLEDCYLNAFFPDPCAYDPGGEVSLTDFQINFSGITFTKQNAEKFNIIWNMKQFINYPLGSFQRTGLAGSATWNNPYLNLNFSTIGGLLGSPLDFLPDSPRGYYVELSTSLPTSLTSFITVESEFTRRNTTATEIPEGPKEPALLGLGLLGLAKLLKRKIASSLPS